jgi:opacity protein-like surface antigen
MLRFLIPGTALLLFSLTPRADAEFEFDLESGAVWNTKANVQIPQEGGTFFSLAKDLDADNPQAFFRGRFTWHLGERHDLSVLYAPLEMDFSGRFDRTVRFAGTDFRADANTTGFYRFDSYRFTYRYNLIHNEQVEFGVGITAKIRDAEVNLRQGGRSADDSNTGFVPLLNYRLQWRFSQPFSLLTEGDALGAPQGHAIDASAALQWHATDNLTFRVGYRILDGGADNDSVYTFSRFHYSLVGVSFRF